MSDSSLRFQYGITPFGFISIVDVDHPNPPVVISPELASLVLEDIEYLHANGSFMDLEQYLVMRAKFSGALAFFDTFACKHSLGTT